MAHPIVDIMAAERTFIRVYQLPEELTAGYCFGGGNPVSFLNVDWFEAIVDMGRQKLVDFIKGKRYFDPSKRYLVLGDHPDFTFVIRAGVV